MRGRSWLKGLTLGLWGVLACAQVGYGAGFALYEGSARGNALGGAMVGRADDPSALFFNPAGITQLQGLQMMAGATVIAPGTSVTTRGDILNPASTEKRTTDTEDNLWVPPHFYTSYQFNDRVWFGLGVFSPFGLGTEFDEDWPGRFNNYKAIIETLEVNPNIALKLNDKLSIAAGLSIMWFDLTLDKKIRNYPFTGNPLGETDSNLEGDSFGYGFNFALHYKPCQYASLGISYRSQIRQHVEGEANFDNTFNDTDADGSITLPDRLFLGLAIYPIERLSFEISAIWTRWSTYDQLTINFDEPLGGFVSSSTSEKEWEDVWRLQFGVEYKATEWLDLRAGYVFDEEPTVDEHVDYLVPANDRHLFSFGPGFHWNNWDLDLSYTYLMIKDRHVDARPLEGVLESDFEDGDAHMFGASVSYKF